MTVLVDSSAWYAAADDDASHSRAAGAFGRVHEAIAFDQDFSVFRFGRDRRQAFTAYT